MQASAKVLAEVVITWATRDKATVPDGEDRWAEMRNSTSTTSSCSCPHSSARTERTHLTGGDRGVLDTIIPGEAGNKLGEDLV
jgi:hypothetical protein